MQGILIIKQYKPYPEGYLEKIAGICKGLEDFGPNVIKHKNGNELVFINAYKPESIIYEQDSYYLDKFHNIKINWVDGMPRITRGYVWWYQDEYVSIMSTTRYHLQLAGFNDIVRLGGDEIERKFLTLEGLKSRRRFG